MSEEISGRYELGQIESSGGFITKRKQWLSGLKENDPVRLMLKCREFPAVVDKITDDEIVLRYFNGGYLTYQTVTRTLGVSPLTMLYPAIAPA
jgi:hypothetical protein